MNPIKPDVVIVGSGPVGLANACVLKCLNKELKIVVIDKRQDTTRRHGLKIEKSTIKKIENSLRKSIINAKNEEKKIIKGIEKIFKSWSGHVIRTNDIENALKSKAEDLGITVLRGEEYTVTPDLLNNKTVNDNSVAQQYLDQAKVIIGADGSHSAVRKALMENQMEQEETLSHLIEFKFQTPQTTKKRSNWEAVKLFCKTGLIDFETMGRGNPQEPEKPATLHVPVSKATYNKFRPVNENGEATKGTFQTAWTEAEIIEAAKEDPEIREVLDSFETYKKDIQLRGGECRDLKVSTIPMNVYRSKRVAMKHHHKYVLLAGDASAGAIFGRGVNKGFQESVMCAESVDVYFKKHVNELHIQLPPSFAAYEKKHCSLFNKEKTTAMFKNSAINCAKVCLSGFARIRRFFIARRIKKSKI